ncbi:MAG: squalene/phytoene synthase family protein [Candidatus Hodarchaeales archaeon]
MINLKARNLERIARSYVKESHKQTYLIILLMVDKKLTDECFKAYAYFRWLDNVVDENNLPQNEVRAIISRQKELINQLYNQEKIKPTSQEEEFLIDLIRKDRNENSYLQSYIRNFTSILEFDSTRKHKIVSNDKIRWYHQTVGKAVTDCIFHFIGNGAHYPESKKCYLAAEAAHITHMLRDYIEDVRSGYLNISKEDLNVYEISPDMVNNPAFREWVKGRVSLSRQFFCEGKKYIDQLGVLRTKITAYWFCSRFEKVLDIIEKDGYKLRREYDSSKKFLLALRMVWIALKTTVKHVPTKYGH